MNVNPFLNSLPLDGVGLGRGWSFPLLVALVLAFTAACAGQRLSVSRGDALPERPMVYFDWGKSEIREQDKSLLKRVADLLRRDGTAIAIAEGHTDPSGPAYYNEILAEARAREVRVYLNQEGAASRQVTITSKGERTLADRRRTPEAYHKNRRVEIFMNINR